MRSVRPSVCSPCTPIVLERSSGLPRDVGARVSIHRHLFYADGPWSLFLTPTELPSN